MVMVPLSVFSALPELGNEVHLYTSMITSKTDIYQYGVNRILRASMIFSSNLILFLLVSIVK